MRWREASFFQPTNHLLISLQRWCKDGAPEADQRPLAERPEPDTLHPTPLEWFSFF
jgi:hypothetical protein